MADEIKLLTEEVETLIENFESLNGIMVKTIGSMGGEVKKNTETVKKNTEAVEENTKQQRTMTAEQKAARDALKALREEQKDARNYVKELAKEQYEAAKQSKTFGAKLDEIAGTSVEFHKGILRARDILTSLAPLGKGVLDLGKAMYDGQQGASANNKALESVGEAADKLASQFGIAGWIVGKFIKLFVGYTVEANKLSDRLFDSYRDLNRVGIAAGDGMTGLAESAKRLGYGLDEADFKRFNELMTKSSQDLAIFGGTALQGRQEFAKAFTGFARGPEGRALQMMGMSVDQINEGLASYIGLQARVGATQGKTVEQLRVGAAAYLQEMDGLTKLTGIQRQELEDNINKARAIEQFRAMVDEMRASSDERVRARAAELEKTYAVLAKQAPAYAQGFAESVTGFITSKEGAQFFQSIDSATGVIGKLRDQGIKAETALGMIYGQAKMTAEQFRGLAKAGAFGDALGNYAQLSDLAARAGISMEEATKIIKESQTDQQKGADGLVKSQVDMRNAQMQARDDLQGFVFKGVRPATSAMSNFAGVVDKITGALGGRAMRAAGGGVAATGPAAGAGAAVPGGAAARMPTPAAPTTLAGLRIKSAESTAGGEASPGLINLAHQIQGALGGDLIHFSAFNDSYHQGGNSAHTKGRALDFTVTSPKDSQGYVNLVQDLMARSGLKGKVLNEYMNPSRSATGGHIHVELDQFKEGGIASGPTSGYPAMLHGTEAVIPLSDGRSIPINMPGLIEGIQELASLLRNQNSISSKILQHSQA